MIHNTITGVEGEDEIIGTRRNDLLIGTAGSETVEGRAGNDVFLPSAGRDHYNGGRGRDTVDYSEAVLDLEIRSDLTAGATRGAAAFHTFTGIEAFRGTAQDDYFLTWDNGETLFGGSGGDAFFAMGGNDRMIGGGGNDRFYGGAGNDIAKGGPGNDHFFENDPALGLSTTGAGNDTYIGGAGADTFTTYAGNDLMKGGGGEDFFVFNSNMGTMVGGGGGDTFSFFGEWKRAVIKDFDPTARFEEIILDGIAENFAEVRASTVNRNGNAHIRLDEGLIVLEGVLKAELRANDFDFG